MNAYDSIDLAFLFAAWMIVGILAITAVLLVAAGICGILNTCTRRKKPELETLLASGTWRGVAFRLADDNAKMREALWDLRHNAGAPRAT